MREACAYNTGSAATASQAGIRITLRSRSAFFTRRTKRTIFSPPGAAGASRHGALGGAPGAAGALAAMA